MADLIAAAPIGQLGVSGVTLLLLALVFRAIVKGDLVPRKVLEDTQSERDHWRTAADKWRDAHEETLKQNSRLIESGRSFDHSWESIREEASDGRS